jgi:hypothetical protein
MNTIIIDDNHDVFKKYPGNSHNNFSENTILITPWTGTNRNDKQLKTCLEIIGCLQFSNDITSDLHHAISNVRQYSG